MKLLRFSPRSIVAVTGVIVLIVVLVFAGAVAWMVPTLFFTVDGPKLDIDYSARYYELAAKTTLTEEELEEFDRERRKGDVAMKRAYEEWKKNQDQVKVQ
jgi:hypothetical protein